MSFLFTSHRRSASIGLAILRIVTGLVFVAHGYQKLLAMGTAGTAGAFTHMGAPLPGCLCRRQLDSGAPREIGNPIKPDCK